MIRLSNLVWVALGCVILTACGGGPGANSSAVTGAPVDGNPNPATSVAFPALAVKTGDYLVYSSNLVQTIPTPAVAGITEQTITRIYTKVNADGSFELAEIFSNANVGVTTSVWNANTGILSSVAFNRICSYPTAYREIPPIGSKIGDSYSVAATNSCFSPSLASTVDSTLNTTGTVQTNELITRPFGSFSTIGYTRSSQTASPSGSSTVSEICSVDLVTGVAVQCNSTFRSFASGQTTPATESSSSRSLEAYLIGGQPPVGAALRRFAGFWKITFGGLFSSNCVGFSFAKDGAATGSCFLRYTNGGVFSVTGSIDAAGQVSLRGSNGELLSGTMTSPLGGAGTWVKGSDTGTWTANRDSD